VLLFRHLPTILLCSFSLITGVFWMGVYMLLINLKINFLNFIAFPITFGIGIDYGVNIFQRYRQEGPGKILLALRKTGSAVSLASLTTIIGYGSLVIAGNQAFVSFGKLAVIGELTCLAAAILVFPSLMLWMDEQKQKPHAKRIGKQGNVRILPTLPALLGLVSIASLFGASAYGQGDRGNQETYFRYQAPIEGGIPSPYSASLHHWMDVWPPKGLPKDLESKGPVVLRGLRTLEMPLYIGIVKAFIVKAPLARVIHLMDDFERYKDRLPDLVKVEVKETKGNRQLIFWEYESPAFFVPNSRYDEYFVNDRRDPKRMITRYQLKSANNINAADGILVQEDVGGGRTRIITLDFFDGQWGILGSVAKEAIWEKVAAGYYKGDVAFKIQVENPSLSAQEIRAETEKVIEKHPLAMPLTYIDNPLSAGPKSLLIEKRGSSDKGQDKNWKPEKDN